MSNIIIGILIGWLAEWLFYTLFWKNKQTKPETTNNNNAQSTDKDAEKLAADLEKAIATHEEEQKLSAEKLAESASKISDLEAKLAEKAEELKAASDAASASAASNSTDNAEATDTSSSDEDVVNNLTTLAGIGPKLHEALNACGIYSFNHIIAADLDELLTALKEKGARFNKANAETWAQQATLAAQGDWSGLDALKAELKG